MYFYSFLQWLAFFYFYCFLGWCFESCYVSLKKKRWVNRGFIRGPFLPLYGCGAVMMLVVSMPFQDHIFLVWLAGCVGATALELVTGTVMEALFKVRYWDYSNQKLNYKGHICLSSTIVWGFFTIMMTEVLHKTVERPILAVPHAVLVITVSLVSVYIISDFSLSFKAALDMRDGLIHLDRIRNEMEHMHKRLDVIIAVVNNELEKLQNEKLKAVTANLRMEELIDGIEERFEKMKQSIRRHPAEWMDDLKEELMELRDKFSVEKENRFRLRNIKDYYQRGLILGNPGMQSAKFKQALEEMKSAIEDKIKKNIKEKEKRKGSGDGD